MKNSEFEINKRFKNLSKEDLLKLPKEFENCEFSNCAWANADLRNLKFIECKFIDCNLSLAKIVDTAFREVEFKNSKLLGLHFDTCNDFGLEFKFENCNLNNCVFYSLEIKNTKFIGCEMKEIDFTQVNLSSSIFDNCDLSNSNFDNSNLEKCDFSSSYNFSINPENNKIKKAKFSISNLIGLLDSYDIEIK